MRTRWIRFRVKYTWVLELWGLGSARYRTLPELSEVLAQAGGRYGWGLPGPVCFLVWASAGAFSGAPDSPAGQTDAGDTRSPTVALLLGLGLRPSLGLEDQADEWWGQLSRTSSPPLTSRLEEPAQDSAEAVGLEALVTSSLIRAPP